MISPSAIVSFFYISEKEIKLPY